MVHGKHTVKRLIRAVCKEPVGSIRAKGTNTVVRQFPYRRRYDFLFLRTQQAAVAGMGVEGKHSYARI